MTITICHNKPQTGKRLESGWCHAQKRCSWEFEDFEKTSVRFCPLKDVLWNSTVEARVGFSTFEKVSCVFCYWGESWVFLPLRHEVQFLRSQPAEMNWDLKHHKMRHVLGWGELSMISIDFYELCLSPPVTKAQSQELIILFVLETK